MVVALSMGPIDLTASVLVSQSLGSQKFKLYLLTLHSSKTGYSMVNMRNKQNWTHQVMFLFMLHMCTQSATQQPLQEAATANDTNHYKEPLWKKPGYVAASPHGGPHHSPERRRCLNPEQT